MDIDIVFLGKLHGANLQNLCSEAGQFQHFVVGNLFDLPGIGANIRIGRIDSVHIGEDFADIGLQTGSKGNCRCIRTAATKRGDISILVNPLESRHYEDGAVLQICSHLPVVNAFNARLAEGVVGNNGDLPAMIGLCLVPHGFKTHGQKSDGNLFSGSNQNIVLPVIGKFADIVGQCHQFIGFTGHGRNYHNHIIAGIIGFCNPLGDVANTFDCSHRGTAIFLYHKCHLHILLNAIVYKLFEQNHVKTPVFLNSKKRDFGQRFFCSS